MKLLCLDLSSNIGFAIGDTEGPFRSGAYQLPVGDRGAFASAYDLWLCEMLSEGVEQVVMEAPIMPRMTRFDTVRKLSGLAWHTEFRCHLAGIPCAEINNMSMKKYFGSGSMNKDDMMEAIKRLGYRPKSYDESDAIALRLFYLAQRFPRSASALNLDMGMLGAVA
jgi:crossover junction endodeoxyribonuclease RuvC